jgi:hypothetical protein
VGLRVEDYFPQGKRWWLRFHEKGGKTHEMPAHHTLEEYLDAYLHAGGISEQKKARFFAPHAARPGGSPSGRSYGKTRFT